MKKFLLIAAAFVVLWAIIEHPWQKDTIDTYTIGDNEARITCTSCNGTGKCSVCNGTGKISLSGLNGSTKAKTCSFCHNNPGVCRSCDGKGYHVESN